MDPTIRTHQARYPIQAVAARTGLTPPLLRAWERRYGVVEPERGEGGERLWRISLRASALGDIDYGRFVDALRARVEPFVNTAEGIHVTYTGVIPLIYKAQRQLFNDLVRSFFLAFGVIALVMVVALRSPTAGV